MLHEIIKSQGVSRLAKLRAGFDDFRGWRNGLEYLHHDAVRGEQPGRAVENRGLIHIDERFRVPRQRLQIKQGGGIDDHAAGSVLARLKNILRPSPKQKFVSKNL